MAGQWSVEGKTFLITGGASGLGAHYAEVFLKEGAKNVALLDVAEATGVATADRLNKIYPDRVIFVKCDVGVEDDLVKSFNEVVDKFKTLDVIINNAGIMVDAPAMWRKACDVNWQGVVSMTLKGIKHMRKDEGGKGGTIINIASTAGITRANALPVYCGSKAAVLHFSQSIAMDPLPEVSGVRIMTLCPGATSTPLVQNLEQRSYDANLGKQLAESTKDIKFQSVESAGKVCSHIFKHGANASVWVTIDDKPAKDITPVIESIYKKIEETIYA